MRHKCRACGHTLNPASSWCPSCGSRVYTEFPWGMVLLVIGVFIVAVVLVVIAVFLGGS